MFSALVLWQFYAFVKAHFKYAVRLGLVDNSTLGLIPPREAPVTSTLALPRQALVYVFHAAFLALVGLFCMHVQVTECKLFKRIYLCVISVCKDWTTILKV